MHPLPRQFALPAAVLSGLLLSLAAPGGPDNFWPLAWAALVPLFAAVAGASPRQAAFSGLLCGLAHYLSLLYWVVIVMGRYGNLPLAVSLLALVLLALYMALYTAAWAGTTAWALRRHAVLGLWTGPFLWVGLDVLRARLFSGFPWQDLGYSQYQAPLLVQNADITGHHGVTLHIVLVNAMVFALFCLVRADRRRRLAAFFLLPALLFLLPVAGYNYWRLEQVEKEMAAAQSLPVAAIQGNIRQDLKWSPAMQEETLAIYQELTDQALAATDPPRLVLWPETALPFYLADSPELADRFTDFIGNRSLWLLSGVPDYQRSEEPDGRLRYFNSAFLFGPDGLLHDRYDKRHLVPFGEYVPLRTTPLVGPLLSPLMKPLVETIGDFTPGDEARPLDLPGAGLGVLICYESIFPELARSMVANGATLLVNLTNDAWFGRSSAPRQHLSMAVLRAVENRRALARAANTGISGFIAPSGRLLTASPLFETTWLAARLPVLSGKTLFVAIGHHFGLLCLLLAMALLAASSRWRKNGPAGI